MISAQTTKFKFINRGYSATLVLLPGWASDHRIFETLDFAYNYIIPVNFVPTAFKENLLRTLQENSLSKVSILGWSLGGFAACEFSAEYSSHIEELILVGIKQKYKQVDLELIKRYLNKNKKAYLNRFYVQCFHDSKYLDYFKENFAKKYHEDFMLDVLLKGLDYLGTTEIKAGSLKMIKKIKIIHGEFDNIASLEEAKMVKDGLPQAEFIVVKGMGHMPFLNPDFRKHIK